MTATIDYFLAPHSDDEAMFGAYTLLRHKPVVVQVLRCDLRAAPWETRAAEAVAGAAVLGCEVVQWDVPETEPWWESIVERMYELPTPGRVWAPEPYDTGHPHHNLVGEAALTVFLNPILYCTYAHNGHENVKTEGVPVLADPGWAELKRQALDCYPSQHHNTSFQWPLEEYLAA